MNITPRLVAAAGAGLAALTTGAVLLLNGTAAATPTGPTPTGDAVITVSVPSGVTEDLPTDAPRPTATVRPGQPVPKDPDAPSVRTVSVASGATVDDKDAPRPTATVTATPAP